MITYPTILLSDSFGRFVIVIDCNKACYDELGLAETMPYEEGMKIYAEREHTSCEYLTLAGLKYDHIWASDWTAKEKPGHWHVIRVHNWPIEEKFSAAGVPVREPKYNFEIGCRANHPDWVSPEERVYPNGKPPKRSI
jgi:hypothetical protein